MIAEQNYFQMDGLGAEESSYSITQKFWNLWNNVKSKLQTIIGMDTLIDQNQRRYMTLLNSKNLTADQQIKIKQGLARGDEHRSIWRTVKDKISEYLPSWMQSEKESSGGGSGSLFSSSSTHPVISGLGWVPIAISVASITALAFVAAKGLSLLKDVHTESRIISDLEQGLITTSQASTLSKSFRPTPASLVTVGGSTSILLAALGAGALILYMKMK